MPTHITTCPLCEALCGLRVTTDGDRVTDIRGAVDDPLSRGYMCPKGAALADLHHDPDRLRQPMRRRPDGTFEPITWDAAIDLAGRRLAAIHAEHGPDAVAIYFGNPTGHSWPELLALLLLQRNLGTRNLYSSASVDAWPRQQVSARLYGNQARIPVPDLDRTAFLLVLGANPVVSNGSAMTAPDARGRLKALRARGGRLVVVDPRRTETAALADAHHFIRPGTDALLLAAMVRTILVEGRARPRAETRGVAAVERALRPFTPDRVAERVGIDADTIAGLARDFAAAPSAVCYARLGTCVHPFGATTTWLVDVLHHVTGVFDRVGGPMFTTPAVDLAALAGRIGQTGAHGRYRSRVRGLPEFSGELPCVGLADEIETPGVGQVRALVTHAGNPALSLPNAARLERALGSLDFMVSIDLYLNETTRHADLVLPPTGHLERDHYGLLFHALAVRNTAKYSAPVFAKPAGARHGWEILMGVLEAHGRHTGGPRRWLQGAQARAFGVLRPERLLDGLLRAGPHRLSLAKLKAAPNGVDLGPLEAGRLAGVQVDLAQGVFLDDLERLAATLSAPVPALVLIGRRSLRSNNSWMHNSARLVKGPLRCTLRVHPTDAAARGLRTGDVARVHNAVGALEAPVEISDEVMPGVVSLPHGWGHDAPGARLSVAATRPGVNVNRVVDDRVIDPVSGTGVLNGVPVEVERVVQAGKGGSGGAREAGGIGGMSASAGRLGRPRGKRRAE